MQGGGSNGGKGGSVYDQSAAALGGAGNIYGDASKLVQGAGIQANPNLFTPSLMQSAQSANPAQIAAGIPTYMNPYTDSVINNTAADIQRMTDTQLGNVGAAAGAAGAFGGSRHGLVESQLMSEAQKNIGDVSAGLRNTGWNQAAGLAGQDIQNLMGNNQFNAGLLQQARMGNQSAQNAAKQFQATYGLNEGQFDLSRAGMLGQLANGMGTLGQTGFNIGQDITKSQGQQGSMQQQLIQSIMDMAGQQFSGYTGSPAASLNMQLQALGLNPLQNATTTTQTSTPGIMDYLGLAAQLGGGYMNMRGQQG